MKDVACHVFQEGHQHRSMWFPQNDLLLIMMSLLLFNVSKKKKKETQKAATSLLAHVLLVHVSLRFFFWKPLSRKIHNPYLYLRPVVLNTEFMGCWLTPCGTSESQTIGVGRAYKVIESNPFKVGHPELDTALKMRPIHCRSEGNRPIHSATKYILL